MNKLLSYLVKEILGHENFEVEENISENGFVNLKITTAPENIGLIIGKKGKTIKAVRSLLRVKATLEKVGFSLDIVEKQ
ncbi:MAG: hypothetical protein US95_C0056G0003 [Candidatus Woesebacteria bacterium GW2011_GWB1_38_5]|uniref:Uncharacterized protein n=4 Tax=Candidatus Woeseibacteriota TaxID=1752722 RepID=A0A0G0P2L7_9BACT|nr:MAG: hypothetical protein US67_C0026G0014 [Candidatus Woesebacteria bacterium GW2011_GWD1_38_10]KKQ56977.1 MAG: hypothetical protein US75_C0001G0034 [Candidatus Woesebacteria bacterium GW2011_GWC1_38_13]KKQ73420.1 MAG: hypothetical protein US95_C0056G0003 [Candidatus Woesebacteria bacterium GW2011_GWB1_38_5]KKQ83566.1 MAG: hypothetical protein UT06_C0020G0029 [Candidatus Woesebacteria bacterium GW2011_GWA1_38_8]